MIFFKPRQFESVCKVHPPPLLFSFRLVIARDFFLIDHLDGQPHTVPYFVPNNALVVNRAIRYRHAIERASSAEWNRNEAVTLYE